MITVTFGNDNLLVVGLLSGIKERLESLGHVVETIAVSNDSVAIQNVDREISPGDNIGFSRAIRMAVDRSQSELLLLVNPDIDIPEIESLQAIVSAGNRPRTLAAPMIYDANGVLDSAAYASWTLHIQRRISVLLTRLWLRNGKGEDLPRFAKIPGAVVVLQTDFARELGPFDENFFLYGEDRELSQRCRKARVELRLARSSHFVHRSGESGKSVGALVSYAQADSALRIARRNAGRIGLAICAIELLVSSRGRKVSSGLSLYSLRRRVISEWWATPTELKPLRADSTSPIGLSRCS